MKMKNVVLGFLAWSLSASALFAGETTVFGKITGMESRAWGFHINTDFEAGSAVGCPVQVGDTYMYDFRYDNPKNSPGGEVEASMILTAYASQTPIAFHIYGCGSNNTRPLIGYIRLKKQL